MYLSIYKRIPTDTLSFILFHIECVKIFSYRKLFFQLLLLNQKLEEKYKMILYFLGGLKCTSQNKKMCICIALMYQSSVFGICF